MSEIETLEIIEQIQSLISDNLQVVSYKWLSRKFLVSSNVAKRVLQELVEKHENELEVIYAVAGWLKEAPATYHVKLVPKPNLTEAKHYFDGNCSVQVYSVQNCIPKDVATIWNAEFIQTEEFFKQPSTVDNCLRDNRFCGVTNSFVKRNGESAAVLGASMKAKVSGISGQAIGRSAKQTSSVASPQKKPPPLNPKLGLQTSTVASAKTENDKPAGRDVQKEAVKDKAPLPPSKKRGQSDKSPVGGSLTNLWGRASSKSNSSKADKDVVQNNDIPDSADAQISAIENSEAVSSDDEPDVNFRRASNGDGGKKRRVVLDDSDEEDFEDAVNLGSPDPPKAKPFLDSKQKNETRILENNLFKDEKETIVPVKQEEKVTASDSNNPFRSDFAALDQGKNVSRPSLDKKEIPQMTADVSNSKKNKATDPAPGSPKRKKVVKTRIDERGREVVEVVWEGIEEEMKHTNGEKKSDDHAVKIEEKVPTNHVNRAAATTKKSPATGNTAPTAGKAGGKKGANVKDPKQGNIMSFFKKKA